MCVFLFILRTLSYSETEKRIIELTDEIQKLSSDVQQLRSLLLSGIPRNGVYRKLGQPHYYTLRNNIINQDPTSTSAGNESAYGISSVTKPFTSNRSIHYANRYEAPQPHSFMRSIHSNYQDTRRGRIMPIFQFKPYVLKRTNAITARSTPSMKSPIFYTSRYSYSNSGTANWTILPRPSMTNSTIGIRTVTK
mgnify:CR=1 FL=1